MPTANTSRTPDWLLFMVDGGRYAIPLGAVERAVAAAEVTPLPGAPHVIRGAANVAGEILPVFDLRRRFSLPAREVTPADQFLIIRAAGRRAILLVDIASGILKGAPDTLVQADRVVPGLQHIAGVLAADEGLVLIHDVEAFLSAAEAQQLDAAMQDRPARVT